MTIGFTWKTPLFIRTRYNKFKTGLRYIELIPILNQSAIFVSSVVGLISSLI